MVSLFFGLPGSGKTTIMAYLAYKHRNSKRYDHIYSNVRLSIPGVTYIDNNCIGTYNLSNCLLLIDEATLFADNRAYKEFSKDKIEFFLLHRHYKCDIYLFTQQWDGVDRKIRVITDRVYYVYKPLLTGFWWSKYYRIPYGIIIPDKNKDSSRLGEIIQGYCKPPFLVRLFAPKVFRPKYYKYFDSFECRELPALPSIYTPFLPKKKVKKEGKKSDVPKLVIVASDEESLSDINSGSSSIGSSSTESSSLESYRSYVAKAKLTPLDLISPSGDLS